MYLDGRKAYWDVAHAKSLRDWQSCYALWHPTLGILQLDNFS